MEDLDFLWLEVLDLIHPSVVSFISLILQVPHWISVCLLLNLCVFLVVDGGIRVGHATKKRSLSRMRPIWALIHRRWAFWKGWWREWKLLWITSTLQEWLTTGKMLTLRSTERSTCQMKSESRQRGFRTVAIGACQECQTHGTGFFMLSW